MTRTELNAALRRVKYVFVWTTFIADGNDGVYVQVSKSALKRAISDQGDGPFDGCIRDNEPNALYLN